MSTDHHPGDRYPAGYRQPGDRHAAEDSFDDRPFHEQSLYTDPLAPPPRPANTVAPHPKGEPWPAWVPVPRQRWDDRRAFRTRALVVLVIVVVIGAVLGYSKRSDAQPLTPASPAACSVASERPRADEPSAPAEPSLDDPARCADRAVGLGSAIPGHIRPDLGFVAFAPAG